MANLQNIDLMWARSLGDPSIRVAILDGPVDLTHQAFQGASLRCLETLVECQPFMAGPATRHGTEVASIVVGQHSGPIQGVAPGCDVVLAPVFADSPDGGLIPCLQVDLARIIYLAVEQGAHVILISAGQLSPSGAAEHYLEQAIRHCADRNVLVVAAAGNDGCECLHLPAAIESVLAVGAMDAAGNALDFSNWGGSYQTQGILAPGENIPAATPGGGTEPMSGTSFAAAVTAGVAALLLSIQVKLGAAPDPRGIRSILLRTSTPCNPSQTSDCRRTLAGKLNIPAALAAVEQSVRPSHLPAVYSNTRSLNRMSTNVSADADQIEASSAPNSAEAVLPSACACGGGGDSAPAGPQKVYAIGSLSYDLGTEARRDSLILPGLPNPQDPAQLVAFLSDPGNFFHFTALTWTLTQESTAIYAIHPAGAFAATTHSTLLSILKSAITEGADQVSVPGYIAGKTTLLNGQKVPIIVPEARGLFNWNTRALVERVVGAPPANADPAATAAQNAKAEAIENFLNRVYFELRNFGVTPQERAINYAATNAFQMGTIFEKAIADGNVLDAITFERSPICRPNSECWDVVLSFFNPSKRLEEARTLFRFTVDVSEVIPVTVGKVRSWQVFN